MTHDDNKRPPNDFPDDDLSDLIGGTPRKPTGRSEQFTPVLERPEFSEGCPACHGTGRWRGRGVCFKCKGLGRRTFKTSPESRAKARAKGAEKAAQREADKAAWQTAHATQIAWTVRAAARNTQRGGTFDFPQKLLDALGQFGTWTDAQLAAVEKLMARDAERAKEREQKLTLTMDAVKIETAFAHARGRAARPGAVGVWTRPLKLRAAGMDLTFTPGSEGSQWAGMIFVKAGDKKLGSIAAGTFKRRFECSDAEAAAVAEACSDPNQAAVAFGKAWGICTVCGRTLTDDQSIARGIGPICAENFGWRQ
ncbi:MAG TPA: DUF6011 domain-containing protein [Xanthobacteraceae bacterium]